jgi:hypothetical protein
MMNDNSSAINFGQYLKPQRKKWSKPVGVEHTPREFLFRDGFHFWIHYILFFTLCSWIRRNRFTIEWWMRLLCSFGFVIKRPECSIQFWTYCSKNWWIVDENVRNRSNVLLMDTSMATVWLKSDVSSGCCSKYDLARKIYNISNSIGNL